MSNLNFSATCPVCKGRLTMFHHASPTKGTEWAGKCPSDHYLQLRMTHEEPTEISFTPAPISIKKSKLRGKT